uniref:Gastrin-releasing peptide n=1 Tax=Crocodylus porosus TaxID=8502 RepID=A0A7M4F2D7_CROPO
SGGQTVLTPAVTVWPLRAWQPPEPQQAGHLMGKKSTEDLPYVYEEGNKNSFSALPENTKQLEDYLQWEETFKYLLRLLEGNENRNPQILKEELPWYTKNTWETDDNTGTVFSLLNIIKLISSNSGIVGRTGGVHGCEQ